MLRLIPVSFICSVFVPAPPSIVSPVSSVAFAMMMVSLPAPALITSAPSPLVIVSVPSLPVSVMVPARPLALIVTPFVLPRAETSMISVPFVESAKEFVVATSSRTTFSTPLMFAKSPLTMVSAPLNVRVSVPPPPTTVSLLLSSEELYLKMSFAPPPVSVISLLPTLVLKTPEDAEPSTWVMLPAVPPVKSTVFAPSKRVRAVTALIFANCVWVIVVEASLNTIASLPPFPIIVSADVKSATLYLKLSLPLPPLMIKLLLPTSVVKLLDELDPSIVVKSPFVASVKVTVLTPLAVIIVSTLAVDVNIAFEIAPASLKRIASLPPLPVMLSAPVRFTLS